MQIFYDQCHWNISPDVSNSLADEANCARELVWIHRFVFSWIWLRLIQSSLGYSGQNIEKSGGGKYVHRNVSHFK